MWKRTISIGISLKMLSKFLWKNVHIHMDFIHKFLHEFIKSSLPLTCLWYQKMQFPREMADSLKNHKLDSENIYMGSSDTLGHLWKKSEFLNVNLKKKRTLKRRKWSKVCTIYLEPVWDCYWNSFLMILLMPTYLCNYMLCIVSEIWLVSCLAVLIAIADKKSEIVGNKVK